MKVVVVRNLYQLVGIACRGLPSLPLASALVSVLPRDSPGQIFTFLIDEDRGRQAGRTWDWSLGSLKLLPAEPEMLPEVELVEGASH